jgi:hypothetical protein
MCLSKVFLGERQDENLIAEDVALVVEDNGAIELSTLFAETKRVEHCCVGEVNLTENYVVLKKEEHGT